MRLFFLLALLGLAGVAQAPEPVIVWRVDGEGRGTPAADESSAFFLSRYHEAIAVDRVAGTVRWRNSTGEIGQTTEGFALALSGSVVMAGDYNVIAFDRNTGAFRWRFIPRDGYAPGVYLGEVADGMVLTGSPMGRAYAIDAEHGVQRWSTVVVEGGHAVVFPPVIRGAVAAVTFTDQTGRPPAGGIAVIEIASGRLRWRRNFPRSEDPAGETRSSGVAVFWRDAVIGSSGDGIIHAYSVETGEPLWTLPRVTPQPGDLLSPDRDSRALAVSGDTLVAGSALGYIIGFDLQTRRERWRIRTSRIGESTSLQIAADQGTAYVPTLSGELVAVDIETGDVRWRRGHFLEGFIYAPAVHGDLVLASTWGAGYFAFRRGPSP